MSRDFFVLVLIICFFVGCSKIDSVRTPSKSVNNKGDIVMVEGSWKLISNRNPKIISKVNFSSIVCDKNDMSCIETQSLLWVPGETSIIEHSLLYNQTFDYIILDWNEDVIKAKYDSPVADIVISISLNDNSVFKKYQDKKDSAISGKWELN